MYIGQSHALCPGHDAMVEVCGRSSKSAGEEGCGQVGGAAQLHVEEHGVPRKKAEDTMLEVEVERFWDLLEKKAVCV